LIVAQHGRGGTPRTLMSLQNGGRKTYYEIAPRLAERGYLVFSPQNPYVFEDRYRQLVRKANPLQWTIYSYIHLQYEQMFDWLDTLPFVDGARIAFIGQSYGGKTAVRVPPVMPRFCLVVATGDFNEGIIKMASTRYPFSFALVDEYEMFEFDLGNTFNYADLAGLLVPRPFMAQRGHADGVAWMNSLVTSMRACGACTRSSACPTARRFTGLTVDTRLRWMPPAIFLIAS